MLLLLLLLLAVADMLGLLPAVDGGEGVREMTEEAAEDDRVEDEEASSC
jgi:hypothetical protein